MITQSEGQGKRRRKPSTPTAFGPATIRNLNEGNVREERKKMSNIGNVKFAFTLIRSGVVQHLSDCNANNGIKPLADFRK